MRCSSLWEISVCFDGFSVRQFAWFSPVIDANVPLSGTGAQILAQTSLGFLILEPAQVDEGSVLVELICLDLRKVGQLPSKATSTHSLEATYDAQTLFTVR